MGRAVLLAILLAALPFRPLAAQPASSAPERPEAAPRVAPRVVVIDPGHGGHDPGSVGVGGVEEKAVALAVGLALARVLDTVPGLEVHLVRDSDVAIPVWERGDLATRLKGDRPGVLLSLHVNALDDPHTRGVETYFLSQARTEHERRVAALENAAPAAADAPGSAGHADPGLAFILNELRNLDHIHWSADLAAVVQGRLAAMHPGRDRGVKQAPLAVITNALMPSVLVELGFISNPDEEQLLADPAFHDSAARALAAAVEDFFRRYPPGGGARLDPS